MDVLEHLRIDGPAFGFDVCDLATDHSVDGAGGRCNFCENGGATLRSGRRRTDSFESQRQESIASEDGDGFAKFPMASGLAAAEVIVVQCRQVIVNQGVGVDEFNGACGMKRGRYFAEESARRLETQDRSNSLSTCKDAVTHGRMNGRGLHRWQRKEPLKSSINGEAVLFEERGKVHR